MTEQIRISNIQNYTMEFVYGDLVLTPKQPPSPPPPPIPSPKVEPEILSAVNITETELIALNITHSTILECVVKRGDEILSNSKKYRQAVVDIWKTMMPQKILQHTAFNFKLTNENGENGYDWCSAINMAFQGKDAKGTLKEIINMVKLNKYSIRLVIRLKTGETFQFTME
jgi:hypothetical protein